MENEILALNIEFVIPDIYYSDGLLMVDVAENRIFGILTQDTFECELTLQNGFLMKGIFYMASEDDPYDTVEVHLQFENVEMTSIFYQTEYQLKVIEEGEIPDLFAKLIVQDAELDPFRVQRAIENYNRYKGGLL
ncbi:MAG TPA: hypothetical protein IAB70_00505 [Candidatus Merdicola faecigallinarum]|uniref:Uncharacterized protein n=1 Tax=Candidatus Merdicola faecigallinarum TaxID=2840862 RepID=A0A9D1LZJ8_9FIRM|nr:hypothetical protein [Candidatus Merdicola faecigallinarum]